MKVISILWNKIRNRLLVMFLIFTILLVGGVSLLIHHQAQTALSASVLGRLTNIARLKEAELERWGTNNQHRLEALAQRPQVRDFTALLVSDPQALVSNQVTNDLLLNHLLPALDLEGAFDSLSLIRVQDGRVLVSTERDLEGQFRSDEIFFQEGIRGVYRDSPRYFPEEDQVVMHISAPVLNREGEAAAVIAGHVDLDEFSQILTQYQAITRTQESYLVNLNSLMVTESRYLPDAVYQLEVQTRGVQRCLQGQSGSGLYQDYRGVPVIGVFRWLPDWNLCLLTEQDQAEAFALKDQLTRTVLLTGGLTILSGLLVGYSFSRTLTGPLKKLTRGADEISRGNLAYQVDLETKDELGVLARRFNTMSENLAYAMAANEQTLNQLAALNEELEDRVAQRTRELARSNQDLEQFAYVASHDLQEPLRMVTSYLQLLERRYGDTLGDEAREFMNYAVDGAIRMRQLINDLLTYSREGTRGIDFQKTDLNQVVNRVEINLHEAIKETGAVLTRDRLPEIIGDQSQLTQLFQNLISNALKFRKEGVSPEVHISAEEKPDVWQFAVQDNGIGMEQKYAERIFVLFQRLHTSETYQGTGIGLALSKRIVEKHNGKIWVISEEGQGATFFFTLAKNPGSSGHNKPDLEKSPNSVQNGEHYG